MNTLVLATKVLRRARGLPARLISQFLAVPPVSRRLISTYETAKTRHRGKLPVLSGPDAAIVAALDTAGVYITSLAALAVPGTQDMLDAGTALAARYRALRLSGSLRNLDAFQASADDVLDNREIFDWGMHDRLLDIAEVYLGLPVGYDGINIFYTKADGRQVAARKWHRDVEDRRMLKIAVYLNDVDEGGGPLEILTTTVPGTESELLPTYPVMTHEQLLRRLGRTESGDDITTCTGPRGTVIFTDTARRYHRGKPAVDKDRCAIFYNYFSRQPLRPFYCERSTLSRAQIAELARPLPQRKRDCLLWRDSLPVLSRLIPPAPI